MICKSILSSKLFAVYENDEYHFLSANRFILKLHESNYQTDLPPINQVISNFLEIATHVPASILPLWINAEHDNRHF